MTADSGTGAYWRPSAPAAPALRVAHELRSDRRLAVTLVAAICAFTLLVAAAPTASTISASFSETCVAAQTDLSTISVGLEAPVSPMLVGENSVFGYDGVLGCCVAIESTSGLIMATDAVGGSVFLGGAGTSGLSTTLVGSEFDGL